MVDLPVLDFAQLRVESVEVRDFRGISHCKLTLEPKLTMIVGPNNSGKTRLLRALAIGLGAAAVEADDLTESGAAAARPATIDIVLAPSKTSGTDVEDETFSSVEIQLMNPPQMIDDEPLRQRFAWRTIIQPSAEGLGVKSDAHVLTFDHGTQRWEASANRLTAQHRALLSAAFVSESRNINRELGVRGSSIRKILSDLDLDDAERIDIEQQLTELGNQVVAGSATLALVARALSTAEQAVGSLGVPGVSAIPTTAEGLARTVDITLDTGSGQLSSRLHGSGSQSLVSLQVQSLLYRLRTGRDGSALLPHPVTLLEEPEAHLHPQAQFELSTLLTSFDGQVVASTHSSHLVASVDHRSLRILRHEGQKIITRHLAPSAEQAPVGRISNPDYYIEAAEKLKRQIERPFGELVFATALIIGDGATERAFLPPLLRHALGGQAHGVCVIDPASMNTPLTEAAASFAEQIGIPWFIFCDDDEQGRQALDRLRSRTGFDEGRQVVMMNGGATENMMLRFSEEICISAVSSVRPDLANLPVKKSLKKLKGATGGALAAGLINAETDWTKWPAPVVFLVELVRAELQLRSNPEAAL